jgi:hypothetical protein
MNIHTAVRYLYDEVPQPYDGEPSTYPLNPEPIRVLLAEREKWRQAKRHVHILMSATLTLMNSMHDALLGKLDTSTVLAEVDEWLEQMSPEFVRYTELAKEATL